jgi:dienelactone hydrolase
MNFRILNFSTFVKFEAESAILEVRERLRSHLMSETRLSTGATGEIVMRFVSLLSLVVIAFPQRSRAEDAKTYPPPEKVRAAFLKLLDRPKVDLDVKKGTSSTLKDGSIQEELTFASEKKADGSVERVPVVVVRPAKVEKKMPAVIVLHGTGGNAKSQVAFMTELVKRGIIGVAIDARYHGARAGGAKGAEAYNAAITRAWKTKEGEKQEHPFYYDTCWDLWRTVDYLRTREDIDGERIGMIGFSMGGIQTWLAASVDERVKVAVPAIAVQSFRWSLENDQWQGRARTIRAAHEAAAKDLGEKEVNQKVCRTLWNKIVPGIVDQFDCPSMVRLFAGRPLLIVSGTKDGNCPYEGAKIAIAEAEKAFRAAGASDRLKIMVEEVGHTVTAGQREAALEWFARWLRDSK